ncbi:MAG: YabP/YqfC family sporulation protein [Bacilli bacterium]|nr:YabP/YqfC family sporulation protein [Bacilli bacterium]
MKFSKALSDFLYDKNYFITIFEDKIHIYRYFELIRLSEIEIVLLLESFKLKIEGNNLVISQMNNEELIIQGTISSVGMIYE